MTTPDVVNTLVATYGVVETLHHYFAKANTAMTNMSVAVADKNPTLALTQLEKLRDSLQVCDTIIMKKENKGSVETLKVTTDK